MGMRLVGFDNHTEIKKNKNPDKKVKIKKPKPNLSFLFYKDYFKNFEYLNMDNPQVKENNKNKAKEKAEKIISVKVSNNPRKIGNVSFDLRVESAGLLIGSGYPHAIKSVNEGVNLGLSLDYTMGFPYIPGSSIKGVVKHVVEDKNKKEYFESLKKELNIGELDFSKDVFLDAEIVANNEEVLDEDFITPHKELTKNPVPIKFLKVKKGVVFRFQFIFKNESQKKEEFVKRVIKDLGLGAKTNVGYGRFEDA